MALLTWWRGDARPTYPRLAGLNVRPADDDALLAELARLPLAEVLARRTDGHQPYLALLDGAPAAYGWAARVQAHVGELGRTLTLDRASRYLWDFATLPAWRGRGIYPRILQAILDAETDGEWFWIIHAPENTPSAHGIIRAGFRPAGELSFLPGGEVALAPIDGSPRAAAGAALLGVPLLAEDAAEELSACWRCVLVPSKACDDTRAPLQQECSCAETGAGASVGGRLAA